MWKAVLVVCSIGSPDKCERGQAMSGPSATDEACVDRSCHSNLVAVKHLQFYKGERAWKGRSYQCNKLPGGML